MCRIELVGRSGRLLDDEEEDGDEDAGGVRKMTRDNSNCKSFDTSRLLNV